ncbi:hypothetical protein RhiirA1_394399 [Rhizophagus irregularis]|uniref:DUF7431 domain-containing protein n=1 Tax=Rhizophagus irregularis TaxID=588596 RepID=A0A2N0RTF8_9GLOM|nr:hypothetical protein RhiirA1_394399 [Rhizophagus irregularis]
MTLNKLKVRVIVNYSKSSEPKIVELSLTLKDNLPAIREILKNDNTIEMNDTLLFSKKFTDGLAEISRENEKDFTLNDIIEKSNDVKTSYTLRLIETSTYWKFLNDLHKLDFGCTMTSNGIKRANQRAFITEKYQLNEIDITEDEEVEFNSWEDRMIKKNLFFVPNMNVKYFAKIGIKHENGYYDDIDKNTYKYRVYKKVSFKIQNLKATDDFIKRVNDALKLEDLKNFLQITEEYGQFIPSEVILGKRFQIDNETKEKEDLLNDYRKWDTIELLEPTSIFELVDDDLRERLYSFFGKRILYSKIETEVIGDDKNVRTKTMELPKRISEIISNKHADCSIFATAIGLKDHYHCQILTSDKEPKLIIHRLKEKSKGKDSELVIGWMVVGNDTNFKSIFPDYNTKSFNNTQFKVLKIDTNDINVINGVVDLNDLMPSTEKPYYIGIPYMDELDPVIGHYFFNDRKKLYIFPYSSKDELRELPKFSLRLLMMTVPSGIFEKNVNNLNNTINFDNIDEFKNFKNIPKFISLYSKKNERGSILLKQRPTHIKVKFPNNKPSFNKKVIRKLSDDNENLKCSFFVPFERFGNKVSEALKVLTNLKNSKDHFFNKENATLLERLINDIENIKNFVDYHISSSEEISKSKILIILKIKKLFEARKFEKSFDNNLVNIQRSIEGSKERDNNNETRDVEVPTDDDEIKVPTDDDEIKVPTDDDENTDDVSIVYTKDANENKTNNNIIRVPTDDANDNSSKIQTKIIIDTNVPKDNDSVELVLSPTDISIPTGKSTIFSSSEIDENGNETTIKTEIKPGKNGKPATTVRKNTIDSKGTTIFELTTLFFEPEENSSEGKEITESDKSMTILQGDQLTKTGDSRKMKKKTKTYSKNETNDFGIVTSTTTEIKTDEDGKPTVTVTTEKFIGNKDEKIPETKFSSSEIDENGNVTTTTTETTTREDGKTEARVRIETKDLNDKTIHNESFVSRPEEISSDVNKEETTLEMVKTDSFGVPMKNQTNTLFSETDEHGIKTIITTTIKTRAKETKVPEVIIKKVKINDNKLLKS